MFFELLIDWNEHKAGTRLAFNDADAVPLVAASVMPNPKDLRNIAVGLTQEQFDGGASFIAAASGLTRYEAEGSFALSLARHDSRQSQVVWQLKSSALKKSRLLELHPRKATFADLGGLDALKALLARANCSLAKREKPMCGALSKSPSHAIAPVSIKTLARLLAQFLGRMPLDRNIVPPFVPTRSLDCQCDGVTLATWLAPDSIATRTAWPSVSADGEEPTISSKPLKSSQAAGSPRRGGCVCFFNTSTNAPCRVPSLIGVRTTLPASIRITAG
jgi:hypothetical protein